MQARKVYRKAVDVPYEVAEQAFQNLPPMVFSNVQFYKDKIFKNAPKWSNGVKLLPSIKILLQETQGQAVHQKCLCKHLVEFSNQNGLNLESAMIDNVVLTQRALICQLLNHKANDRSIPKDWYHKYACVWDLLSTPEQDVKVSPLPRAASTANDSGSDGEVEFVEPKKERAIEPVDLVSEESSDEIDMSVLFTSSNPALQAILSQRRRITGKQHRPDIQRDIKADRAAFQYGVSFEVMAQLTGTSSSGVTPNHFKTLNARLKLKAGTTGKKSKGKKGNNSKGKKGKTSKGKKGKTSEGKKGETPKCEKGETSKGKKNEKPKGKDMGAPKITSPTSATQKRDDPSQGHGTKLCPVFLKREHSKKYHHALSSAISAGESEAKAKEKASAAGRARLAELRQKFQASEITHTGVPAEDVD